MRKNLPKAFWARAAVVGLLVGSAWSCDRAAGADRRAQIGDRPIGGVRYDSMGVAPDHVSIVPSHARKELDENSAAAMSGHQPGVFFTINDSGNDPILFAMDTTGADRGAWRVRGATNVDWESAAIGPCASGAAPRTDCVYIGDTGDNMARHTTRAMYRVREPLANGATDSVVAESFSYTYSDGPHDVEAMYVATNGDMFFITKRPLRYITGVLRPALVFRLPPSVWSDHKLATAQLIDSLPIVPGSAPLRHITDASLAMDGRHLAVRTYAQVFIFGTDPLTGRINHSVPPSVCNVVSLGEPQGEGVTWADAKGRLVFTSEGQKEPIRLATCPLPRG